jgi:hypothetical protein
MTRVLTTNDCTRLHIVSDTPSNRVNVRPNIVSNSSCNLSKNNITYNIESLCVPKTYYNFYKTMRIEFEDSSGSFTSLAFSVRNYTLTEFMDELVADMTFIDPLLTYTWGLSIYDKLEITANNPGSWSIQVTSKPLDRYLGAVFEKIYLSSTQSIGFDYVYNFERTCNFLITGNLRSVNNISYDNIEDDNQQLKQIVAANTIVGVYPCAFDTTETGDTLYHRKYYGNISSSIITGSFFNTPLEVELRDDDLELIELNGQKWTIDIFLQLNF